MDSGELGEEVGLGGGTEPSREHEGYVVSDGQLRLGAEPGWSSEDRFSRHQAADGCGNLGHS